MLENKVSATSLESQRLTSKICTILNWLRQQLGLAMTWLFGQTVLDVCGGHGLVAG